MSVVLHVGLLAWALWAVHITDKLDMPDTPPIDVAIITPSELTRLRQGDRDSKELTAKAEDKPSVEISKKEAPKPKPITAPEPPPAAPPPAEPEAAKAEPPKPEPEKQADPIADKIATLPPQPEPKPGPTPGEVKKLEEKKQAEEEAKKKAEAEMRKAEAKKKAEERKKKAEAKRKAQERKKKFAEQKRKEDAAKKKLQFDPDRIAALLDKTPDKKGAPSNTNAPDPDSVYKGPTAGTIDGKDSVLSVREQDLLLGLVRGQLRNCWQLPGGGGGSEIPVVTLRWLLNPDGSLHGVPQVENGGSGPMAKIAVETAIRAVHQCAPFTLPPDKYDAWKELIWDFDPRRML
jgi:colicin import membrane protein